MPPLGWRCILREPSRRGSRSTDAAILRARGQCVSHSSVLDLGIRTQRAVRSGPRDRDAEHVLDIFDALYAAGRGRANTDVSDRRARDDPTVTP